jgi:hypothetical protein
MRGRAPTHTHLLDLWRVPVPRHAVRVDSFRDLRVKKLLLGAAAGAADSRLGVDDDVLCLDQAGLRCTMQSSS